LPFERRRSGDSADFEDIAAVALLTFLANHDRAHADETGRLLTQFGSTFPRKGSSSVRRRTKPLYENRLENFGRFDCWPRYYPRPGQDLCGV
jgi:hypothetical protein